MYHLPLELSPSEHEHRYDHGVLITKVRATVLLGEETHEVETSDMVRVQPSKRHRSTNRGKDLSESVWVVPPWVKTTGRTARQRLKAKRRTAPPFV